MRYYEWELNYLDKKIKDAKKKVDKAKESSNSYRIILAQRELDALKTIKKIVGFEAFHLEETFKKETE